MVLPPTPEDFAGGLANPGGPQRGGRRGRNQPAISVDPNTVSILGRVREAMRGLKAEIKGVADQAERYARAMGTKPGMQRPSGFPEPVTSQQRAQDARRQAGRDLGGPGGRGGGGGGGRGGQEGGLSFREEFIVGGYVRDVMRAIIGQVGAVAQRESITTRTAMAMPGVYNRGGAGYFGGDARNLQQMLRREGYGFSSTSELWGGAQRFQELGILRSTGGPQDRELIRQASLAGRVTGLGFAGGAEAVAGFRRPQFVSTAMHQFGITSPFEGSRMRLFNEGGQAGLLEQLNQRFTRGLTQEQAQGWWSGALAEGSQGRMLMESMGMTPEQMRLMQQYGAARAEGVGPESKELRARFKDTGEDLRELQESFSELMSTLSTGLIPIIKGLNTILKPAADWFSRLMEKIPMLEEALGLLVAAFITAATTMKIQSKISAAGGLGDILGMGGGVGGKAGWMGKLATRFPRVAGGLGKLGKGLGWATAGLIGGDIAQGLIGGDEGGIRNFAGGVLGGAARGAGIGALVGNLIPIPGVGAGIGAAVGGVAGGIYGGIKNLFGDAWPEWMREDVGDANDVTPKDPTAPTASGKDLPGAKGGDQNMNPEFVKRLQQMFADNPRLSLTSGWRDSAAQARLYREKPHLAAPPGKSNHERGTAADIGPPSEYGWIAANVGRYGLFLPMPNTADRKAKGKKIEPWHVEPIGLTGSVPVSVSATGEPVGTAGAAAGTAPKPKPSPEVAIGRTTAAIGIGGTGFSEAARVQSVTGGSQIGDAWEGDNEVPYAGTGRMVRSGGSITIGRIEINLTIARGTPEEAERTARYLGTLLGDRDRMLALARNGGKN